MSVLEEAPGYSVINGLPHDMMHDLYEGIVPYELKLLLQHCVSCKYFTIDELNERIERTSFAKNKPRLIDPSAVASETKIRQSASQMMALSQHIPLLIADKIPLEDLHWKSFLLLLRICSIANSLTVTPDTLEYLSIIITEKLQLLKEVYPNNKLIPKHHYMVHYPSQIQRLGPLIHSWTMRQESKLNFVKKVSHQSNYKNICKTVARKHQFWMGYQFQSNPHILMPQLSFSPKFKSNPLIDEDTCIKDEFIRLIPSLSEDSEIKHFDWVEVQSSILQKGSFLMIQYDIDQPTFCKVADILCYDSTVILYAQKFLGEVFISHYNAFCIRSNGDFCALDLLALQDYRPIVVRSSFFRCDRELYALLPYYY